MATLKRQKAIIHIGTLVPRGFPNDHPGWSAAANNFQYGLLTGLASQGLARVHSLSCVYEYCKCITGGHKTIQREVSEAMSGLNIEVARICTRRLFSPFLNFIFIAIRLVKLIHEERRDVTILIYNPMLRYAVPAFIAKDLFRIPVVVIAADIAPPGSLVRSRTLREVFNQLVYRARIALMRRCSGLISLNTSIINDFDLDSNPYVIIEGGVPGNSMGTPGGTSSGRNSFNVLYSGALSATGGISLLMDAFSRVGTESMASLWITGMGFEMEAILRAAGEDERIQFLGFLDRPQYESLLQKATVLVNPRPSACVENRYTFPSKLLEYLATGKPVITTATVEIAEEYADKAFILREETPGALASLIEDISQMPPDSLLEIGARAREYVLNNKNWDIQAKRVSDFLERIIDLSGRGQG